jgi:hypothetical protein
MCYHYTEASMLRSWIGTIREAADRPYRSRMIESFDTLVTPPHLCSHFDHPGFWHCFGKYQAIYQLQTFRVLSSADEMISPFGSTSSE